MDIEKLVWESIQSIEPGVLFDAETIADYLLREHPLDYFAFADEFIDDESPEDAAAEQIGYRIDAAQDRRFDVRQRSFRVVGRQQ
ncbi:hypothetical protein LCGC14_2440260, partial [marine sediment metagenome]